MPHLFVFLNQIDLYISNVHSVISCCQSYFSKYVGFRPNIISPYIYVFSVVIVHVNYAMISLLLIIFT